MLKHMLRCCRLAAATILFAAVASSVGTASLEASDGGCLPSEDYMCITDDPDTEPYEDKFCDGNSGCKTCDPQPEAICNAFQKDSPEGWYDSYSS